MLWQVAEVATHDGGGIGGGGSIDCGGDGIGISNGSGNDVKSNGGLFKIIMVEEIWTMTASSTIFSFGALYIPPWNLNLGYGYLKTNFTLLLKQTRENNVGNSKIATE